VAVGSVSGTRSNSTKTQVVTAAFTCPGIIIIIIIIIIYLLQLGCYPLAVVILHVNTT